MKKKLVKIAVTGGAGSGKSSACRLLADMGFPVVDLDALARDAVMPGMPAYHALVADFGPAAVGPDGQLNRAWLRERLTRDPAAKARMEAAIHPVVYRLLDAALLRYGEAGAEAVVVEFPLLYETGREAFFDLVLVVSVPREVQMARLMTRDGVDPLSAERLIQIQMPLKEKAGRADFVLENTGTPEDMEAWLRGWIGSGVLEGRDPDPDDVA